MAGGSTLWTIFLFFNCCCVAFLLSAWGKENIPFSPLSHSSAVGNQTCGAGTLDTYQDSLSCGFGGSLLSRGEGSQDLEGNSMEVTGEDGGKANKVHERESLRCSEQHDPELPLSNLVNEYVKIPAGTFTMGTDNSPTSTLQDGEGPAQRVQVSDFEIQKFEVSNDEFAQFVESTGYVTVAEMYDDSIVLDSLLAEEEMSKVIEVVENAPWLLLVKDAYWLHPEGKSSNISGRGNHPVVHISVHDAVAYCKWKDGGRLPTEAEWEYAARGGLENQSFPWGNSPKPRGKHWMNTWQGQFPKENTKEDGYLGTGPVDSYHPNKYGLYNMVGNVWEWVSDWWTTERFIDQVKVINPTGPLSGSYKVKKGGSYMCQKDHCYRFRCSARSKVVPGSSACNLGMRCARSIEQ